MIFPANLASPLIVLIFSCKRKSSEFILCSLMFPVTSKSGCFVNLEVKPSFIRSYMMQVRVTIFLFNLFFWTNTIPHPTSILLIYICLILSGILLSLILNCIHWILGVLILCFYNQVYDRENKEMLTSFVTFTCSIVKACNKFLKNSMAVNNIQNDQNISSGWFYRFKMYKFYSRL